MFPTRSSRLSAGSGVNLAGILGDAGGSKRLVSGGVCGGSNPSYRGSGDRNMPPSQKKKNFHLKWRVLMHSEQYFLSVSLPEKNVEFSAWRGDLVDIEDVLLGNSEYSVRIIGLISFLLHRCIVMQAILCVKFWNMTKSGKTICIRVPHSKFWGTRPPF